MEQPKENIKEQRIREITHLYYSRPEIQKAIFSFSQNREVVPRYFETFGKRPDAFQYPGDIFELVKNGATSFHCSEELWRDALKLSTDMKEKELADLRIGWDLLIDIDSKYIDYSKISAELTIKILKFHGIKNFGVKFSVSADTPILIKNNQEIFLVSISDAIDKIKKGEKLEVLSLDKKRKLKFSKIYNFLEHEDVLYEIKHSQSTIPLKTTRHHSVFVWEDGGVIQKKVANLKKGDFLISFNSQKNPLAKNLEVIHNFHFSKNQYSKKIISKKIKITKELMRLIGYFLAEGHVTNVINQVGFSFNKSEVEYIEDVKNLLSSITQRKISIRHPNPNSTQILIHSKEWSTFFDNFCGKKRNKHIPPFAFNASQELFTELLRGYIRGDGYKISEYGVVIKSVSKRLITEMVWLCKFNGISCNISFEQTKPHKLPQGNLFKGSLVYMLRIPKSELDKLEFNRKRNKFSPYPGDKIFPIDGLKKVYRQIKPKMFNYHRIEQTTLRKKRANLDRIKKVLDWFEKFREKDYDEISKKIIDNYKKLFNLDMSVVEVKEISKSERAMVYDVSVEETESFFGNYYPILLHNSGSKGFHILIPWKAFPSRVNEIKTSEMFPEWPRIIVQYIHEKVKPQLIEKINDLNRKSKYVKDFSVSEQVMPDLILVSPRHLFRMPYSLHEKTALASVVLSPEQIKDFQPKDANPLKIKIREFIPESKENEAQELLIQALDWHREKIGKEEKRNFKDTGFKPLKIKIFNDDIFPPSIKKILQGVKEGRKRSVFILINFFRSIGVEKDELEKRIYEWNNKNEMPLKQGYIKSQLSWSYRNKIVPPPNYDKDYYKGIGIIPTEEEMRYKNPVNYMSKKTLNTENKNQRDKNNPS